MVVLIISCNGDEENYPNVVTPPLKVTPATLNLVLGDKGTVEANIAPVTWNSNAPDIVHVDASTGENRRIGAWYGNYARWRKSYRRHYGIACYSS
ncbi:MAG: hypothetical protein LBG80_12865 [Bacteroidales bacterium]|nr:hypothetical protein [Bacteroidales bacterium]